MTCDRVRNLLSDLLDDELPLDDRRSVLAHLQQCPGCGEYYDELQTLDREARHLLGVTPADIDRTVAKVLAEIQFSSPRLAMADNKELAGSAMNHRGYARHWHTPIAVTTAIVLAGLALFGAFVLNRHRAQSVGDNITLALGRVEIRRSDETDWHAIQSDRDKQLVPHMSLRLQPSALCEIRTRHGGVIRMDAESEIMLIDSENWQLVRGLVWFRAPANNELIVRLPPTRPKDDVSLPVMRCPQLSEVQCNASAEATIFTSVGGEAATLRLDNTVTREVRPGESVTLSEAGLQSQSAGDPPSWTSWQLPLLALKSPHDQELLATLHEMLVQIGRSKSGMMSERQIRALGPAGVLPLIAYVQSDLSRSEAEPRLRAMQLVSELSTIAQVDSLRLLATDSDPKISQLASDTLNRLFGQP